MATRQGRQGTTYKGANQRQHTYRESYVQGNTARKLDVRSKIREEEPKVYTNSPARRLNKVNKRSIGYIAYLGVALLLAGYVLINYIQLQSDITNQTGIIASMQSELNILKLQNDEELARINSSIDLEDIRRVAIGELGMTYASEGQINKYTNESSDYVRQFANIPQ